MVWTVPSPSAEAIRCRPSSLYTFPFGLGSGLPPASAEGFPDFGQLSSPGFPEARQTYQGSALPLSYSSAWPYRGALHKACFGASQAFPQEMLFAPTAERFQRVAMQPQD